MTGDREFAGGVLMGIAIGLILGAIFGGLGCAHTCQPPERRAAKLGNVLECIDVQDGTRCLISTPDGDVYHFYRDCE